MHLSMHYVKFLISAFIPVRLHGVCLPVGLMLSSILLLGRRVGDVTQSWIPMFEEDALGQTENHKVLQAFTWRWWMHDLSEKYSACCKSFNIAETGLMSIGSQTTWDLRGIKLVAAALNGLQQAEYC